MTTYSPYDWYWLDATGRVFASARQEIVTEADPDYVAWLATGNTATVWPSDEAGNQTDAALQAVLTPYNLWVDMAAYNAFARYNHASGGVVVTSISPLEFLTDPVSRNSIASAYEYIKANPGSSVDWKMSDGTFIVLNEAQLGGAVSAIAQFVQSCFTKESENLTAINGGSITTTAEIDAAYAAISNVFA